MTFRGGARIGLFNASWPFAMLRLEGDSLALKVFSRTYALRKEEVQRLEYFHGWFSVGVKIVHTSSALAPHAIFWSFEPKRVLYATAELGFSTVDEKTAQQVDARPLRPAGQSNGL